MNPETIFSILLGSLISILVTIFIENQRQPKLCMTIEYPPLDQTYKDSPAKNVRFLRVQLWNKPISKWFQWLGRNAALNCRGSIQFFNIDDGVPLFTRDMPARWAGADQPFSPELDTKGNVTLLFDASKYQAAFRRDCYPGTKETMDVAAKFDDEEECYGWSNDSYIYGWRNKNWKLPQGHYLVSVVVLSTAKTFSEVFKLENATNNKKFLLTEASNKDKRKIKKD